MKNILLLFLLSTSALFADTVRIGSLNCYLFLQPGYTENKVELKGRPDSSNYTTKVEHLAQFVRQVDVVGLQETEGNAVRDLAKVAQYEFSYIKGRDTYTGENTGILIKPSLRLQHLGRVGVLNKLITKHTLVRIYTNQKSFLFLTVHLIRPIGARADKNQAQLNVIRSWAEDQIRNGETVVIVGDFNNTGKSLLGTALVEVINQPTHLDRKQYDHIYVSKNVRVKKTNVERPNYAKHPSDAQKTVWTDHYFASAVLEVP